MTAFLNFLTGTLVATLAVWVNKVIALFSGTNLSLRDWQHEADLTAAAFGTGVALVTAAIAVFVPKWVRLTLAVVLLGASLYLGWRCIGLHALLATTPMAIPDSNALRDEWRLSYISMLLTFVAALTFAAASIWSEKTPPVQPDADSDPKTS
jgi:hypothetical protein